MLAPDLEVALAWQSPDGRRNELFIMRETHDGWTLRIRSGASGRWPIRYTRTAVSDLEENDVGELSVALERSDFFGLPPRMATAGGGVGRTVTLRLRQRGRAHQVTADGRMFPSFARALEAIDRASGVSLPPWPAWSLLAPARAGRPRLADDTARAVRFHRDWLAVEPRRRGLLVDLFALHLARRELGLALSVLSQVEHDPDLSALAPELRRRVAAAESGH